jgi:hypothetical protein
MSVRINYGLVGRELLHPSQQRVLETLVHRERELLNKHGNAKDRPVGKVSPVELFRCADTNEPTVTGVAYHFKALRDRGWITIVEEEQRRGAMEHYHALTDVVVTS